MCRPYIEFVIKNIKSVVFIGSIIIALIVFFATLNPRINSLEDKVANLEERVIANEKEFSTTTIELKTALAQIQSDLNLIKAKLLK